MNIMSKAGFGCSDAQVERIHSALLSIRNMSRYMLLDDNMPAHLHKRLVDIENLADLSESLIASNDAEVVELIDNKLRECR